jgi:inosine-uridine nucleoside N-ribohydrolase
VEGGVPGGLPARRRREGFVNVVFALILAALVGCAPAESPSDGTPNSVAPNPSGTAAAASPGESGATGAPIRLVIDTDVAPDDVVAIASLLRDPAAEVLAITVVGTGEAHCRGGMFVARSVVTMLAPRTVPVTCGPSEPLGDAESFPDAWRAGADAGNGLTLVSPTFAPDQRAAPELLVELAAAEAAAGGRLAILTLGTLTNLAAALDLDPELPAKVRVVSMLGAVDVPGNVMTRPGDPTAEWNAHADPTAARRVLEAGFDLTLVPLDATNSVPLGPELYEALASDHTAGPADLVFELFSRNQFMTSGGFYLWDPLAAAVIREPAMVTTREATLRVVEGADTDGGRLLEAADGDRVVVATSADRPTFEAFLLARLRIGPPRAAAFNAVGKLLVSIGAGRCEARLEPTTPPAGLFEVEVANDGSVEEGAVVVFGLGDVPWSVVQDFAAHPPGPGVEASAPPVVQVAFIEVPTGAPAVAFGDAPAGQLGVACLAGTVERPEYTLAGPFAIGG